jgi:hypothetical protein
LPYTWLVYGEHIRKTVAVLQHSEPGALSSARYLETAEGTARRDGLIVAPGEDCERQRLGCFLPRPLAGENPVGYLHDEFVGIVRVSGGDVGFSISQMLFCFRDLPGQVADLPADMTLLIGVNCAQLVQLADLRVDLDLFNDGRIAGGNRLNLRVGKGTTFKILR